MTTCSARELAQLFNIGERHVRKLVQAEILPAPVSRGQYGRDAAIRGYLAHLEAQEAAREEPARVRLMRARARLLEIQVAERESQLVSVESVRRTVREMHALVVRTFDESRARLAPLVAAATDPLAVDRILADEISFVCRTLSAAGVRRAAGEATGPTI